MNRRLEEELLQTAFGEASPEEMAALERRLLEDPEAAGAFKTYQFMKDGLKDLREVPEHQLSTERLRHAILQQGLKPKRESIGILGWAWAPAAIAAVVFAFMLMRQNNGSNVTPNVVVTNDSAYSTSGASDLSPDVRIERPNKPAVETTTTPETQPSIFVADKSEPRRRRGGVARFERGSSHDETSPRFTVVSHDERFGPPMPEEPIDGASVQAPWIDRKGKDEIIVIQPERDVETGANKATEVGSASNVAIGG